VICRIPTDLGESSYLDLTAAMVMVLSSAAKNGMSLSLIEKTNHSKAQVHHAQ
jgi:hypothetical protein